MEARWIGRCGSDRSNTATKRDSATTLCGPYRVPISTNTVLPSGEGIARRFAIEHGKGHRASAGVILQRGALARRFQEGRTCLRGVDQQQGGILRTLALGCAALVSVVED